MWIIPELFTKQWLKRAERENEIIDDGDKFISLWIAFNSWLKHKYGESKNDNELLNEVIQNSDFEKAYKELEIHNIQFKRYLDELAAFSVINMKHYQDRGKDLDYDGSFSSLMRTIYQIRCNLFHGRKDIEVDKNDQKLVELALKILLLMFKEYLNKYAPDYL